MAAWYARCTTPHHFARRRQRKCVLCPGHIYLTKLLHPHLCPSFPTTSHTKGVAALKAQWSVSYCEKDMSETFSPEMLVSPKSQKMPNHTNTYISTPSCNFVEQIWKIPNQKKTRSKDDASYKFPAVTPPSGQTMRPRNLHPLLCFVCVLLKLLLHWCLTGNHPSTCVPCQDFFLLWPGALLPKCFFNVPSVLMSEILVSNIWNCLTFDLCSWKCSFNTLLSLCQSCLRHVKLESGFWFVQPEVAGCSVSEFVLFCSLVFCKLCLRKWNCTLPSGPPFCPKRTSQVRVCLIRGYQAKKRGVSNVRTRFVFW